MSPVHKKIIEDNTNNHWNIRDDLKHLTLNELQMENNKTRLPFAVCALNITGDLNIGIMMRSACLLGASKFFIIGRKRYDRRTTVGSQNYILVERHDAMLDETTINSEYVLSIIRSAGYTPISVECSGTNVSEYNFPKDVCLIFGNEGIGIPTNIINNTDCVSVPQYGVLRSLNVSSAASIVMYETMKFFKNNC